MAVKATRQYLTRAQVRIHQCNCPKLSVHPKTIRRVFLVLTDQPGVCYRLAHSRSCRRYTAGRRSPR
jgi:hypothetical protein